MQGETEAGCVKQTEQMDQWWKRISDAGVVLEDIFYNYLLELGTLQLYGMDFKH